MKTAELTGGMLALWVARAHDLPLCAEAYQGEYILVGTGKGDLEKFAPHVEWQDGGPLIPGGFTVHKSVGDLHEFTFAEDGRRGHGTGPTLLIAAMRALVQSVYGDEVQ